MAYIWRSLRISGFILIATVAFAQGEPPEDVSELSTYGGVGFGIGGARPWVGGSTGVSPSKYFMALIDASFLPLGGRTLRTDLLTSAITRSRLYDFNFTGQIQIPTHHRVTPYGLLGAGILFNTYTLSLTRPSGVAYLAGRSDVKFAFETGGGVRYFISDEWGVRGEYRYTVSTQNFNRLLVGVFYQFSGTWPFRAGGRGRNGKLPY